MDFNLYGPAMKPLMATVTSYAFLCQCFVTRGTVIIKLCIHDYRMHMQTYVLPHRRMNIRTQTHEREHAFMYPSHMEREKRATQMLLLRSHANDKYASIEGTDIAKFVDQL